MKIQTKIFYCLRIEIFNNEFNLMNRFIDLEHSL